MNEILIVYAVSYVFCLHLVVLFPEQCAPEKHKILSLLLLPFVLAMVASVISLLLALNAIAKSCRVVLPGRLGVNAEYRIRLFVLRLIDRWENFLRACREKAIG